MPSGTIERKCTKGHKRAEGLCSPRCVRWYPRIQHATPDDHGRRRFDYLGGYPTKAAARSALDQALRRDIGRPSNPSMVVAGLTLNDLLPAALTPEQVGMLLAAVHHDPRPWLGAFTILAAATGARTGELCGLEWEDLDIDAGTVRFRQALSSIDQQLATGRPRPDGRRGKLLVVGPLKTPASQAVLSLPAFAVDALRDYQQLHRQRTPLRLLLVQPGQPSWPVELDLLLRTERDTPVRPEHASRVFRAFAQDVGVAAHPHLLRHSLASAMAAAKEPASVIAGQLRHADGGTLASRTYIHQLPQTPPRLARLIEDLYGPAASQARLRDRK